MALQSAQDYAVHNILERLRVEMISAVGEEHQLLSDASITIEALYEALRNRNAELNLILDALYAPTPK